VGRLEVRDWVDVIECDRRLQPLGYLAWAACGKDPGFGPGSILAEAVRTGRYSREEIESLAFDGPPPDAEMLARQWHDMVNDAREVIVILPGEKAGTCVLGRDGALYVGKPSELPRALASGELVFHRGSIRGALPQLRG